MGKCMNVSLPRWDYLKLKGILVSWDVYDVLNLLLQIPLQTTFYLGTFLLALQVMWMNVRPINPPPERPKSKETPIKPRNMTVKELSRHNGVDRPNVYTAVNGKVFDVSRSANSVNVFAGKDASRALANFSFETSTHSGIDDLCDLNPLQMDNLLEWEMQYFEKYPCVGRLVSCHQPNSLQTICLAEICAVMKGKSSEERHVASLPLPKPTKKNILNYGRKIENAYLVRFS